MRTLRFALIVAAGIAVAGCKSEQREAERKRNEAAQAERAANRQAEREAEQRLMSDPDTAKAAIEQRIGRWLTKRGPMLLLNHDKTHYAVPASAPWFAKCDHGEVTLALGPWSDGNDGASYPLIEHHLTSVRIPADQCDAMLEIISDAMLALLGGNKVKDALKASPQVDIPVVQSSASPANRGH